MESDAVLERLTEIRDLLTHLVELVAAESRSIERQSAAHVALVEALDTESEVPGPV